MIKLINLLELQINNPNVTVEEVEKYFDEYASVDDGWWEEYDKLKEKYSNPNKPLPDTLRLIIGLSQSELNRFYREMKQLVQKYS